MANNVLINAESGQIPRTSVVCSGARSSYPMRSGFYVERGPSSPPVDQHAKGTWNCRSSGMGAFCSRCGRRSKVRGVHEQVVSLRIQAHRFCAEFGLDGFGFAEFIGRVFVEHVEVALERRYENQAGLGFVGGGIHSGGDRE